MGKKQRIKDISLGVLIGCMFAGSMPMAMAAVAQINLPVSYNDIKIVIAGKRLNTDNEPFISEGVTYLPVRAIAEAVGKDVSWDGETNTVYIDEKKPETENGSRRLAVIKTDCLKGEKIVSEYFGSLIVSREERKK